MKVVVAIDSLKGSLTSMEAGKAVEQGILRARPQAQVVVIRSAAPWAQHIFTARKRA